MPFRAYSPPALLNQPKGKLGPKRPATRTQNALPLSGSRIFPAPTSALNSGFEPGNTPIQSRTPWGGAELELNCLSIPLG
jgi:hypothetical protein